MPSAAEIEYLAVAEDNRHLEEYLQQLLGLNEPEIGRGVRCYSTQSGPTKQMKNKLSQALSICQDGLMHLRVGDKASHDEALSALRERWETNPQWPKLAAVALAYPHDDGIRLASVVVHADRPFVNSLRTAFPSVEVHYTLGAQPQPEPAAAPRADANLPDSTSGGDIWLELFAGGTHGGAGWEHGVVLWSPTKDRGGADRYAPMRFVKVGDLILHAVTGDIVGFSRAAATVAEVVEEPPQAGNWSGMSPYYRIDLRDYQSLARPISLRDLAGQYATEILNDVRQPDRRYYPFCEYGGSIRTNQGMYLTKVTPFLYGLIQRQNQPLPVSSQDTAEELFMDPSEFMRILTLLREKKNMILQGPPGVGKTLVGERLAWTLIGDFDAARLGFVQFHQSYAYEDFVQGYRPTSRGTFVRRDGAFLRFCNKARSDGRPHVFIIDEINRGNVSKIFGELLLLIERDKRDKPISLAYHTQDDAPFSVPPNVFIIGMMNTADRSLAVVDYALRRRFAFVTLEPQIESPRFRQTLVDDGVDGAVVEAIVNRVGAVNRLIREDTRHLGPGFEIGHSFFCGFDGAQDSWNWYRNVISNEIGPLLIEYWYPDQEKAREQIDRLTQ